MNTENKSHQDYDASNLIFFLIKWRKPLIAVILLSGISSAIASFMVQEKFLSTVIMFPASTSSISKSVMTEDVTGKNDIVAFGEEEQAEQMLQILNSDEIRNKIIGKYNLMEHWGIKPTDKYKITTLNKLYDKNVNFKRTEFLSIRIDVLDPSPDTAALIANDIAEMVDSVKNRMQQERAQKALKVIEYEYFSMKDYMQSLDDSLTTLRKLGLHEYEKQIEKISEQYYAAIASNNKSAQSKLEEKLNVLSEHGSAFIHMTDILEYERERMILLRSKYEETMVDATQNIPHKFIVNRAYPAEKKEHPVRWLIVVVSVLASFLTAILIIIFYENINKYKEQLNA